MAGEINFAALSPGLNYSDIIQSFGAGAAQKQQRVQADIQTRQLARQEKEDVRTDKLRADTAAAFDPATGEIDPSKARMAYANAGDLTGAMSVDTTMRAAKKASLDAALAQNSAVVQLVGSARDQASYDVAKQKAGELGLDVSKLPPQYDPAVVGQMQQQALTVGDQLKQKSLEAELEFKKVTQGETIRHNNATEGLTAASIQRQSADAAAGRNVTLRGQAMTDARARDTLAQGGKAPAGYSWGPGGSLVAIKGGPADTSATGGKPLTESQSKATGFYARAQMSNKIINAMQAAGEKAPGPGARFADGLPLGIGASLMSDVNQRQLGARRGFITGVLRQDSGATIMPDEFKSYDNLYFSQPGDSAATVEQKAALREKAVQGLYISAGAGAKQIDNMPTQTVAPPVRTPRSLPPKGSVQIGTSGGKPVYRDKSGRPWVEQ